MSKTTQCVEQNTEVEKAVARLRDIAVTLIKLKEENDRLRSAIPVFTKADLETVAKEGDPLTFMHLRRFAKEVIRLLDEAERRATTGEPTDG